MLSKDVVDCSLNVALCVDLVSNLGQKCILISVKTDTVVPLASTVSGEGTGLRPFAVGVLDVDVVEFGIGSKVDDRSSVLIIGCSTQKRCAVCNGYNITGI